MVIAAVIAALLLGFTVGLLSFRVKSRWCPECGATTLAVHDGHGSAPGGLLPHQQHFASARSGRSNAALSCCLTWRNSN